LSACHQKLGCPGVGKGGVGKGWMLLGDAGKGL